MEGARESMTAPVLIECRVRYSYVSAKDPEVSRTCAGISAKYICSCTVYSLEGSRGGAPYRIHNGFLRPAD